MTVRKLSYWPIVMQIIHYFIVEVIERVLNSSFLYFFQWSNEEMQEQTVFFAVDRKLAKYQDKVHAKQFDDDWALKTTAWCCRGCCCYNGIWNYILKMLFLIIKLHLKRFKGTSRWLDNNSFGKFYFVLCVNSDVKEFIEISLGQVLSILFGLVFKKMPIKISWLLNGVFLFSTCFPYDRYVSQNNA